MGVLKLRVILQNWEDGGCNVFRKEVHFVFGSCENWVENAWEKSVYKWWCVSSRDRWYRRQ